MDSRLGDIIPADLFTAITWRGDALEWIRLSLYSGMQLFVIFMAAFFFLFLYYFAFGFVVGSIAESNTEESVTKVESASTAEPEGNIKEQEVKVDPELSNGNTPAK